MTDLRDSEAKAAEARARMMERVKTMRQRMKPQSLLQDGREMAKDRAIGLATATLASKKARPILALSAIAAGAAYLLRKPLARSIRNKLIKEKTHD